MANSSKRNKRTDNSSGTKDVLASSTGYRTLLDDNNIQLVQNGKLNPIIVRFELNRYIDHCVATGISSKAEIIKTLGVNHKSYRNFMNTEFYKDSWSAVKNNTYTEGIKLLLDSGFLHDDLVTIINEDVNTNIPPPQKKIKTDDTGNITHIQHSSYTGTDNRSFLIPQILAVEGVPDDCPVFDSCPQLVVKINQFLRRSGISKAALLAALGNINHKSLNEFLTSKQQERFRNVSYRASYIFFEKLRILEGQPKSQDRLKNELMYPDGFPTKPKGPENSPVAAAASKTPKKSITETFQESMGGIHSLISRIYAVEGVPSDGPIYDTCPEIATKIHKFLLRDGVTKNLFCTALGNINHRSLRQFLDGEGQDRCGNITYRCAYVFFEKLRILEGKPKSEARLKNEQDFPEGFSIKAKRSVSAKILPVGENEHDPYSFLGVINDCQPPPEPGETHQILLNCNGAEDDEYEKMVTNRIEI